MGSRFLTRMALCLFVAMLVAPAAHARNYVVCSGWEVQFGSLQGARPDDIYLFVLNPPFGGAGNFTKRQLTWRWPMEVEARWLDSDGRKHWLQRMTVRQDNTYVTDWGWSYDASNIPFQHHEEGSCRMKW